MYITWTGRITRMAKCVSQPVTVLGEMFAKVARSIDLVLYLSVNKVGFHLYADRFACF